MMRPYSRCDSAGRPRLASALVFLRVVAVVATGLVMGCRGHGKATLLDLDGIDELQARFNRDAGKPRIVLLLSPT